MLEVRDLWLEAGDFRLSGVDLGVERGECHVLIGPTGAGKTLLLEGIAGLLPAAKGTVLVDGGDVTSLSPEGRGIAYVPQDLALFPHLDVEENLRFGLRYSRAREEGERVLRDLISFLELGPLLKRRIAGLSGGERQRVALVRALAAGRRLLLLDEPFSAIHAGLRRELWRVLRELIARLSPGVLLVTHDVEEAFFLGDRVSVLLDGKIRQSGGREEVYRNPADREVARLLGVRNLFPAELRSQEGERAVLHCPGLGRIQARVRGRIQGPCLLGFRGEEVQVGGEPRPGNEGRGVVRECFPGGGKTLLLLGLQGSDQICEIQVPGGEEFAVGEELRFWIPEEKAFVVPSGEIRS
ncbi:MAG TPA: ABC transporter ATP-binding protein [Planctomycetes bacterium]|nr:ABC transporter ATP-binding protein [Planctomycetota bacterium]